jgi:hypothetical protein
MVWAVAAARGVEQQQHRNGRESQFHTGLSYLCQLPEGGTAEATHAAHSRAGIMPIGALD